jgi:hypothetical protein
MDDATSQTTFDTLSLRSKAAAFRKLAAEHEAADNRPIAAKLREVAARLEAKADALENGDAPHQPPGYLHE